MNRFRRVLAAVDLFLNGMVIFIMLVMLMRPFLNPPASAKEADPPGNVLVHIVWPAGNTDVDLWLMGPGEPVPIGYSNKNGRLWNLLRDDLGTGTDATPLNFENAYTRGIVPGIYHVNLHCFRCPALPVPVDVEISLNKDAGTKETKSASKILLTTRVDLTQNMQELTVVSFKLSADGVIDSSSLNSVFRPLRSMKKATP